MTAIYSYIEKDKLNEDQIRLRLIITNIDFKYDLRREHICNCSYNYLIEYIESRVSYDSYKLMYIKYIYNTAVIGEVIHFNYE